MEVIELIDHGVKVHPGEKIGYLITNAKAKKKAERVSTSNHDGSVQYDRQEYAARLKVAAKELGIMRDDDSFDELCRASTNRDLLFPL
jgi:DNA polymerase elongation subunit (family B)